MVFDNSLLILYIFQAYFKTVFLWKETEFPQKFLWLLSFQGK